MRRRRRTIVIAVIATSIAVVGIATFVLVALLRSVPPVSLVTVPLAHAFPGRLAGVAWQRVGQRALAVQGVGFIGARGGDRPLPIASVAKIMTAFIVLRDHPLRPGQDGPRRTITPADGAGCEAD